jgi:VWFA-related protein
MKIPWAKLTVTMLVCGTGTSGVRGQASDEKGTQQTAPKIELRSILVSTPVTVRDANGALVHNLEATSFKITDDGVEQKITHFDFGGDPISLVIVVETSSRISPVLPKIRKMGVLFTQQVAGPMGEAAIVGFNDEVEMLLDFTTDTDKLEKTMHGLKEGYSGARLFDAMSRGVEMLTARPAPTARKPGRRRVMMVLSEAHDSGSEEKLGEVLRRAQLANVTIYTVGLSSMHADMQRVVKPKQAAPVTPDGTLGQAPWPEPPPTLRGPEPEGASIDLLALTVWAVRHAKDQVTSRELEIAALATGGTYMKTWKDRSIEQVIDELGGELHTQYSLSYVPSDSDVNGYHEIQVTIDRPELKVRARPGYYLGGSDE